MERAITSLLMTFTDQDLSHVKRGHGLRRTVDHIFVHVMVMIIKQTHIILMFLFRRLKETIHTHHVINVSRVERVRR